VLLLQKRNPKAPDFKHKQEGNRVVWMTGRNTPAWVEQHIDTVLPPAPPPREWAKLVFTIQTH